MVLLLLLLAVGTVVAQNPLTKAWNEAVPGVQPFWEKYQTGPHGVVIRGWQFSRCASEQVLHLEMFNWKFRVFC